MFQDVLAFHRKFELPCDGEPRLLSNEEQMFRVRFLREELHEIMEAYADGDIVGVADGLVDLVYVALGTAVMMGLPWQAMWDEVHRANLRKVRAQTPAESKRGSTLDVVKPGDWTPPDLTQFLSEPTARGRRPEGG